ncbi:MAG: sigma-70 family RNA polymerase sigma factor [Archangium sp.]
MDDQKRKWISDAQRTEFDAFVAELSPAPGTLDDLALAFAATRGDQTAARAIDTLLRESRPNVARIDGDPSFLDEVHQTTLERLFAPDRPRLREYKALGPLGAWLRATAVRVALDLKRATSKERPEENLEALMGGGGSEKPHRSLTAKQVSAAIRTALDALSPRDRTLLKLHYFEGTTLDALARTYNVHRASVARWLADARAVVMEKTRAQLSSTHGGDELSDALMSVQSQLDVSFRQVFESGD